MKHNDYRNRLLTAAVLATLLAMPGYGYAYKQAPEYLYYNGKPIVEMQFLSKGEELENIVEKAKYTLDSSLVQPVKSGTAYWTGLLGPKAKNTTPWQIFVSTDEEQNASANSSAFRPKNGELEETKVHFVAQQLQDGKKLLRMTEEVAKSDDAPLGDYGISFIYVGRYMGANREGAVEGWWSDADTVLPTNEQASDFVGTIRHELGHALGIARAAEYLDEKGNVYEPKSEEDIIKSKTTGEVMMRFSSEVTDKDSWNLHLADQNLNPAKPGMEILSAAGFAEKKKKDGSLKESDFFIVNNDDNGEDTTGKKGKAFFVGSHVTDALAGATFFGVSGLPVNAWESGKFEGSHLQTSGMMSHRDYSNYTSFMEVELAVMQDLGYDIDREAWFGHSVYGDGGTITNTQGYFARNEAGTAYVEGKASAVPLGIGLHIYGSRNKVTQAADILTNGTGATGVRMDGMQNRLVVPAATNIRADGLRGNGILISYGRDQAVDQAGTVTADGKGGTGIRFDFGSSTNGAMDEYRGSYIRYKRSVEEETGTIETAKNLELTDMEAGVYNAGKDELDGPLVKEYNLTGTLSGAENAIYIGRNAFVKNINIKKGAAVNGNITSDWKHFNTDGSYDGVVTTEKVYGITFADWMAKQHPGVNPKPGDDATKEEVTAILQYYEDYEADPEVKAATKTVATQKGKLLLQYNGNNYEYDAYIPDLATDLNFTADMAYGGNITGPDNMKLHVNGGTLVYAGKADVVGVTVAPGATLLGGSYTVHDMSSDVAADYVARLDVTDQGNFVSRGTIGAADKDSSMVITGNLISDEGTLQGVAGGSAGDIKVSGKAVIDGSEVKIVNAMPDDRITVLTAKTITGDTKTPVGTTYELSGMLNAKNEIKDSVLSVTTEAANNLEDANAAQNEAFAAMVAMDQTLKENGDARRSEMETLFGMDAAAAKAALSAISSNAAAKSMALTQRSMMTRHLLSSRLNEAFVPKPVKVKLPEANLDGVNGGGPEVSLTLLEPAENDIWLKFGKNWGDLRDGADYHSSTTLLGWDKAVAPFWRAGVYAGYSKTGFSDATAGNELKDTRVGLYAGYNKAGREGLVFLNYGWLRNELHRVVMGMTAGADYHSRILELGGEYLYDLHAQKDVPWHVRPYVNVQLSRLWQDRYSETGAGVFNQVVDSKHNNYFGAGAGVEFKRYLAGGNYAIRAGIRRAVSGAEPKLRYSYMGDQANTYNMDNVQDKTHFVLSVGGETQLAKGWSLGGDAAFQRGRRNKDWSCGVSVKHTW